MTSLPPYGLALSAFYELMPDGSPMEGLCGRVRVLHDPVPPGQDLETVALEFYRRAVGKYWDGYGAEKWMAPWQLAYQRRPDQSPDVVSELGEVFPRSYVCDRLQNLLQIGWGYDATVPYRLLRDAFDDPAVCDFRVYWTGDDDVMSGLLMVAARTDGDAIGLSALVD